MTTTKRLAVGTTALGAAGCAVCCAAPVAAVAATTIFAPLAGAAAVTAAAITVAQRRKPNHYSQNRSTAVEGTTRATQPLRMALAAILVASAALFALGVAREHSIHHHEASSSATIAESGTAHAESGGESSAETSTPEAAQHREETSSEGRVLGVDLESWPLVVAAVAASIALAILLLRFPQRPLLVAVGIFLAVAAVFDIAESVHQINDSQQLLAVVAIGVAALHVAGLAFAMLLVRRPSA